MEGLQSGREFGDPQLPSPPLLTWENYRARRLKEQDLRQFWSENWIVILIIGGMLAAFLAFRTRGDDFPSTRDFDIHTTSGIPSFVEFYSNT
jgi:hypothetical protein